MIPVIGKKIHVLAPPFKRTKLEAAFWHCKFRGKSEVDPQRSYNLS